MGNLRDYSVKSSGFIGVTGGQQVVQGAYSSGGAPGGVLHGVLNISNGTNATTCIVYHGTSAVSGNELCSISIPSTTVPGQAIIFHNPIACPDGIFIVTTGTGSNSIVYYSVGA